ncbi:DUF4134 domain-containing protein [Parabacteroides merdae]|jgi:hypothetical protein|uniref:DUF4134 domain-containing protein n=1 Tax=Parabacteroides merdae TaxID=46503 RepID=UPI0034A421DC
MIFLRKIIQSVYLKTLNVAVVLLSIANGVYAQDRDATAFADAIDSATTQVEGTFESIANLCLVVGAIVGLVGGVQIYIKWNNGDQDVTKRIIGWGGACLFLVATGSILKVLFLS